MTLPAAGYALASWLATYLLHSTFALGAVALAGRGRSAALQDLLWKAALVAPILTASFGPHLVFEINLAGAAPFGASGMPDPGAVAPVGSPGGAGLMLVVPAWAAGAALALARVALTQRRTRAELGTRRPIVDPAVLALLHRVRRAAGFSRPIRLTTCDALSTPAALGIREVCLPGDVFYGLSVEQRESVLAHEVGHLARRDPLWRLIGGIIAAALFFQPLNHLACRRLRTTAEILCDDFAVVHTGRRRPLAEALGILAARVAPGGVHASAAVGGGASLLMRRARRLADGDAPRPSLSAPRRAVGLAGMALLLACAPAVRLDPLGGTPHRHGGSFSPVREEVLLRGVRLSADGTRVERIAPGGFLDVVQHRGTRERRLTVRASETGELRAVQTIDGVAREFDADAETWLAAMLRKR